MTTAASPTPSLDVVYRETELYLPSKSESSSAARRMYLPSQNSCISVDEYISTHSVFYSQARQNLVSKNPLTISSAATGPSSATDSVSFSSPLSSPSPPIIYIHQREVGYVSSKQYGGKGAILVSDSATTCHILALRSTSSPVSISNGCDRRGTRTKDDVTRTMILGSLCHLDSTDNESCIRRMVARHYAYHASSDSSSSSSMDNDRCHLEIHIVGGYRDKKAQSSAITSHVVRLFADLAAEYASTCTPLTMELSTCAVTSLNDHAFLLGTKNRDDGTTSNTIRSRPIAGGMSLDVTTGKIHLLSRVHESLRGPAATLRRVRLWAAPSSRSSDTGNLMVVHTEEEELVVLSPFQFRPFPSMHQLMVLPDDVMLQYTSTSPECEADDFCELVRDTFMFLRDVRVEDVFTRRRKVLGGRDNDDDDDDSVHSKFEAVAYRLKGEEWCKEDII